MDWVIMKEKCVGWLKKYKFILLVLLVGLVLITLPTKKKETSDSLPAAEPEVLQNAAEEEARLENILARITGVGEVDVMLTLACSQQTVYQTDSDSSDSGNSQRTDTVIITESDRANTGLVTRVDAPRYMGAVIVCKGGNDPSVQLAVVDAVSKALGLDSSKISVLKMK